MRNRKSMVWSLIFALTLVVAACSGGGASQEPAASETPQPTSAPQETDQPAQPTEEEENEPVTLVLSGRNDDAAYQEAIAEQFMKQYPHITVEVLHLDGASYEQLLMQNKAAGTLPDVGFLAPEFITRFLDADVIQPISEEGMAAVGFSPDDLYDILREGASVDGQLYLIPRTMDVVSVFLNKTMFQNAGLPLPTDDWTWDQFLDLVQKLTVKDAGGNVTQYGAFMHNAWEGVYHTLWQANGADFVDFDAKKVTLTDPKVMQAVQTQLDAIQQGYIADDMTYSGNAFLEGKAAMWFHVGVLAGTVNDAANEKGFEWDVVSYPALPNPKNLVGFAGYFVSKETKHPKEASMLAAFIGSELGQTEIFSKSGSTPANRIVAEKGDWMNYPVEGKNTAAFIKYPERYYYNFASAKMPGEVYATLHRGNRDSMIAVIKGEKSLVDAYTAVEQTINEMWAKQ